MGKEKRREVFFFGCAAESETNTETKTMVDDEEERRFDRSGGPTSLHYPAPRQTASAGGPMGCREPPRLRCVSVCVGSAEKLPPACVSDSSVSS
ncbi:hypothetical protein ABZP36_019533 [Zizania latifolia]